MISKMADGDDEKSDKNDIGGENASQNNGPEQMEDIDDSSDVDSIVDGCSQEYHTLNQTFDHLNTVLNSLEEKNDDLIVRALALLQDNKDVHDQILHEKIESNHTTQERKS